MRLSLSRRYLSYLIVAALVVTGLIWLVADQFKNGEDAEGWQRISATTLMIHGGFAMAAMVLFGMLFEAHMLRGWRAGRNTTTGVIMAALTLGLIFTAFGLYYSGSDAMRSWISIVHIALGLAMPVLIVVHIWIGRRLRPVIAAAMPEPPV